VARRLIVALGVTRSGSVASILRRQAQGFGALDGKESPWVV
jgi:hypothetical protein